MQFKSVDRIQHFEFGYWDEVYNVWHKQGLPEYIKDEKVANEYFGFGRFELNIYYKYSLEIFMKGAFL